MDARLARLSRLCWPQQEDGEEEGEEPERLSVPQELESVVEALIVVLPLSVLDRLSLTPSNMTDAMSPMTV